MASLKRLPATGFLARLGRDEAGNVLAMTAAAVIPMIGVVGGAIDASRLYMVRSRLQAACDSAVLAGRRAMVNATYDSAIAQPRAQAMFNANYKDPDYQTTGPGFSAAADGTGRLNGTATKTVPMTLMKMFGFGSQTLTVTCSADIQIPNIDVVFVLDATGSMRCRADEASCNADRGANSKMASLRTAAVSFYRTLAAQMQSNGTNAGRIRYGFVPYDQTVRVTDLFRNSPDANQGQLGIGNLTESMPVQTRTAVFAPGTVWFQDMSYTPQTYDQTFKYDSDTSKEPYQSYSTGSPTNIDENNCDRYASNRRVYFGNSNGYYVDMNPSNGAPKYIPAPHNNSNAQNSEPSSGSYYYKLTFSRSTGSDDNTKKPCTRRVTKTKFIPRVVNQFQYWSYREAPLDTSVFRTGAAVNYVRDLDPDVFFAPSPGEYDMLQLARVPNTNGLTIAQTRWNGCIEERDTVADENFVPIPAGARDLDVLAGATNDSTRWRPIFNDLTWYRGRTGTVNTRSGYTQMSVPFANGTDNDYVQCPNASIRNLQVMTETEFTNYVNTITPGGNTYLDVGMVWGLRLIMPQGMWGARNLTGPNGGQISRHVIFLTDGVPVSSELSYSAYGMEVMAGRITGNTGEDGGVLHARRFQALCESQRGNVNIWAIAFGTAVTGNLENCADPGRAFQANDATQLNDAFNNIARTIADLRLVQ